MREPINPIYTELLTIMLNSELVELTEEKTSELLTSYADDEDDEKDFKNNQWFIISIGAEYLVLSSEQGMYTLDNVTIDELKLTF